MGRGYNIYNMFLIFNSRHGIDVLILEYRHYYRWKILPVFVSFYNIYIKSLEKNVVFCFCISFITLLLTISWDNVLLIHFWLNDPLSI